MSHYMDRRLTRKRFFQIGAGAAIAGAGALSGPGRFARATPITTGTRQQALHLGATDGWVGFPNPANASSMLVDPYAPDHFQGATTYVFGFRDLTPLVPSGQPPETVTQDMLNQRNKAQAAAPLLWVDQEISLTIHLTNLGLQQRPDLTDSHTIHWHGFRNAPPIFDGVPEMSIAVPLNRTFPYNYNTHDPGTYIYHCHFEDVEHVQMGMTGIVFVRPTMGRWFTYNHSSTAFDREYALLVTEWWSQGHYNDAHIQESDWTDFEPDICMFNGRTYPDTILPNGSYDSHGEPVPIPGIGAYRASQLRYQPISSLVRGKAGEKVLLRVGHLGYKEHSIRLDGIPMTIVGRDATHLQGRDGTLLHFQTSAMDIGPGESFDAIVTLPPYTAAGAQTDNYGSYNAYGLYDRDYGSNGYLIDGSAGGQWANFAGQHTGMRTEVRVYDPNTTTLTAQTEPNTP